MEISLVKNIKLLDLFLIFDIQNASNGFPDDKKSLTNETLKLTISKNDIINNNVTDDNDLNFKIERN